MAGIETSVEFGVNILQDIITSAYGLMKKEHQKKDFFKVQTTKYVKNMMRKYGKVKVLGQTQPADLMHLYVRANILDKIRPRLGVHINELKTSLDFEKRDFNKELDTKDAEEIANQLQKFIVLGKPGAGKSTFLRYIALAMLHKQSVIKERRLPIFVILRDWAYEKKALINYIADQFDICGFTDAELFVENALRQGKCLVLFDGLDEVSQEVNLDIIIRQIQDFSHKYSDNQFIISCRVAAYNHWFEQFTDIEISDFDEIQIKTFVKNWFAKEPMIGEVCLNRLTSISQLNELATVPLLLALLCITFEEYNEFPNNRAELYERAIDALLTKWDYAKRVRRGNPYKQLSVKRMKDMCTQIAFQTFLEDQYFIRKRDLARMIEDFINNMPGEDHQKVDFEGENVLKNIEAKHGIFVERARNIYSFGHLTFQEYFAAKYFTDLNSSELSKILVEKFLHKKKWREVFLLSVSMLPNSDRLLLQMMKRNRLIVKNNFLDQLLRNLGRLIYKRKNKYSKVFRGAMGIYIILDLARDLDLALDLDLTRAVSVTLALALALDESLDHTLIQILEKNLVRVRARALAHALNLDINLARVQSQDLARDRSIGRVQDLDLDHLKLFLEGNKLIVDCLNTDCHVSNEVRREILNNLLEPLAEEEKREMGIG